MPKYSAQQHDTIKRASSKIEGALLRVIESEALLARTLPENRKDMINTLREIIKRAQRIVDHFDQQ